MNASPPPGMTLEAFDELLRRFGFTAATAQAVGGSQNFVYEVLRDGVSCIARVSSGRYRKRSEIEAELNWIRFLRQRGLSVCPPLISLRSQICEETKIRDRSYILAVFPKAPGRKPERNEITEAFCFRAGELIGQMHSAALYALSVGQRFARDDWRASRLLTHDMETTAAPAVDRFRIAVAKLTEEIAASPSESAFGLIHGDVNSGNCHIDEHRLWIFDFDNCEYGYFLYDLAVMLYDTLYSKSVKHVTPEHLLTAVKRLWDAMISGYRTKGPSLRIDADMLRRFFLLREAIIFVHYHRVLAPTQLAADPYVASMKLNVETMTHPLAFERLVD